MAITLNINDRAVQVPDGSSVLDAINTSGTYISQLCKDPDMKAIGACRTCLVEIDGVRGFPASCGVPAAEGMRVSTESLDVRNLRKNVLELTQSMMGTNGNSSKDHRELDIALKDHGVEQPRWTGRDREPIDTSNPIFNIAMDDCILCGRCAQACQDGHQFIGAIDFPRHGYGQSHRHVHGPSSAGIGVYHVRAVSVGLSDRRNRREGANNERGKNGLHDLSVLRRRVRHQGAGG